MASEPERSSHPWWRRLLEWRPSPYRSRADRLSSQAQGDAAKYWLRGGR